MVDWFGDDKIIFKKEVFLTVLFWSIVTYVIIFFINVVGLFILGVGLQSKVGIPYSTMGSVGLLFIAVLPLLTLGTTLYFALKKNWKRFKLLTYRYKVNYLAAILVFMMIYDVIVNLIITKEFHLPQFGLLAIIIMFIIPTLIKDKRKK
tara:strand:- start:27 stop:473 length:447 start_codon:yes stop_codon:yes gene_type:complete